VVIAACILTGINISKSSDDLHVVKAFYFVGIISLQRFAKGFEMEFEELEASMEWRLRGSGSDSRERSDGRRSNQTGPSFSLTSITLPLGKAYLYEFANISLKIQSR
jgi:hypothetical protein